MNGVCETFCPHAEAKMRIKNELLHFFEYKNSEKRIPGVLVKEFSRSAAGVQKTRAKDLRTLDCLYKTVKYLLKTIIQDKRSPAYCVTYDFIFDRLRAVRQEIVIQQLNENQSIKLLEPMIMFLAYSRYRLDEQPISVFDPKICDQHLQECLKRVLTCYDKLDEDGIQPPPEKDDSRRLYRRSFIESLYQIFNLGSTEAMARALTLPRNVREDIIFRKSFIICMNYHRGNMYRVLIDMRNLPHLVCGLAWLKLQAIRRRMLEEFTDAYNSKTLQVPVEYLLRVLLFDREDEFFEQCNNYNIEISEDRKSVRFSKANFNKEAETMKSTFEPFVENKLFILTNVYLTRVLLQEDD